MSKYLLLACVLSIYTAAQVGSDAHGGAITVRNITYENAIRVTPAKQSEIGEELRKTAADAFLERSVKDAEEQAEELVREEYQNQGYFKVRIAVKSTPVSALTPTTDLNIVILEEGEQYWLRDLRVENAKAFSDEQLLSLFPVRLGEIFDRSRFVTGLEALKRLYASNGYINFTPTPNLAFDDSAGRVSVVVGLDEDRQFRMGRLVVLGLNKSRTTAIAGQCPLQPGAIFRDDLLLDFLKRDWPFASFAAWEHKVNEKDGTVDIVLQFRPVEEGFE